MFEGTLLLELGVPRERTHLRPEDDACNEETYCGDVSRDSHYQEKTVAVQVNQCLTLVNLDDRSKDIRELPGNVDAQKGSQSDNPKVPLAG